MPEVKVRWVRRNRPIAPVPYIQTEDGLPTGQRVFVFLPHSDDGRYIGGSLYLMNRRRNGRPLNRVDIVMMASGYRGVKGELSRDEKSDVRKSEAACWAETLGFRRRQVVFFDAEGTYEGRKGIRPNDQERMDGLIACERPTMVFLPHISDTARHITFYTRQMVLKSAVRWLAHRQVEGEEEPGVFVVEYPTDHVPLLPPSDKNLIVAFTDTFYAELKHQANKAHVSQEPKQFDLMEKFVEAIEALGESDDASQMSRAGQRFSRLLSDVPVNPRQSRGEHFGVTCLHGAGRDGNACSIVESRLQFPLDPETRDRWFTSGVTPSNSK